MDNKTKWKLYDKCNLWIDIFNEMIKFGLVGLIFSLLTWPLVVTISIAQVLYAIFCVILLITAIIGKIIFQRKRNILWRMLFYDNQEI